MKRLVAALLLVTSTAFATTDAEKDRARQLFDQGNAMIDSGKYVEALDKFRAAYAIWPNPKILLNIATTLRALGRNAEAADAYERYVSAPDADPKKRDEAKAILDSLDKTVGKLKLEPAGKMRMLVDGKLVGDGDAPVTIRVEPGVHVVVCESTTAFTQTISVAAGETRSVELKIATPESKPAATSPPVVDDKPRPPDVVESPVARRIALMARADVDASFRGAVAALGVGYRFDRVELGAAALLGRQRGAEPYAALFVFDGMIRPVVFAALPLFFVEGVRAGARGGIGVHVDATSSTTFFAHASAAHFFAAPAGFVSTYGILTLGAQLRF